MFLVEASVLTQTTYGKEYVVFSDASLNGLGCVFMQEGKVVVLRLFRVLKLFPSVGTDVVKHYNIVGVHRSFPQEVVS